MKIENKSFEDILKESLLKCKNIDEKFLKIIEIVCNETRLIDIILNNLSPEIRNKILKEAGFSQLLN